MASIFIDCCGNHTYNMGVLVNMKVAIYCRESSDDTKKAPPIAEQIKRGEQWAQENNHELVRVYADNGFSGGNWNRPDWNQCIKDAKRHQYAILWTWNQDRLARDTEQFLFFCRNLDKASVRIYEDTSKDFIDLQTLGGRVKHQTLAQASEIFRLVTSEKVKQAYQRRKKGTNWGRPKKDINLVEAIKLRESGSGWRTIAKELGVSHNTIRRALQNSAILEHTQNKESIEGKNA